MPQRQGEGGHAPGDGVVPQISGAAARPRIASEQLPEQLQGLASADSTLSTATGSNTEQIYFRWLAFIEETDRVCAERTHSNVVVKHPREHISFRQKPLQGPIYRRRLSPFE